MITVVVPTYNEEKNIERCLQALSKQTIPHATPTRSSLSTGNSKDKTCEIAAKYADRVHPASQFRGRWRRNDGAKAAKGDIIATTDADCLPDEDWLKTILEDFTNEDIVAVTGYSGPHDTEGYEEVEGGTYATHLRSPTGSAKPAPSSAITTSVEQTPPSAGKPS